MKRSAIVLALAALLPMTITQAFARAEPNPWRGARYVAMGASFAAGPGLPMPRPGVPPRCGQSMVNYPTLLATELELTLHDASCSGATTENVLKRWNELPPQIDALTPQTRLVTLTVGGNDVNYVGGLFGATSCELAIRANPGKAAPCPPARQITEAEFLKLESNLREIAMQVNARAPQARLVFVTFLTLVPSTLCKATPIAPVRADAARALAERLAQITARVARETGSLIVRMDEASRDHTPCDPEPWTNGAPPDHNPALGIQWHPNPAGMRATAAAIAETLLKPPVAAKPESRPPPETTPRPRR
ncbi:SGNH/GDSL hydrolase family protein [Novosphingobium album (ex Liu et al. 2023)]|uniref:SGNH/GDSL hydrolase family protein n=1 Tax=Novosphingobium album (ex Liu et al. 2023) TaxID=3031130 RepID=A0ABT5WWU7_9SPHN|nr:SGNH/GDSL hydrolase family protein [Novosphingobium album (ex Liu et al. 2023)]MDE8654384.1 SGNH/GDSL hydrolase family protein [Novosphingobium album (ex Liu et al. 2023)]